MNDLVEFRPMSPMTVVEVKAQVTVIKQIMQSIMIEGVHYGKIPGTDRNTLLKLGADTLLSAFHIAVEPIIEDLSAYQEIRYRIQCRGLAMGSGTLVGIGIGECSSNEEKYKWKKCSEAEYDRAVADQRRIKIYSWKERGQVQYRDQPQIRAESIDVANTVLKMAKKRAQVDMTYTALACGDVFRQPAVPDQVPKTMADEPQSTYPPEADIPASFDDVPTGELNLGMVRTECDKAGLREVDVLAHCEVSAWQEITGDKLNQAMKFIEENAP